MIVEDRRKYRKICNQAIGLLNSQDRPTWRKVENLYEALERRSSIVKGAVKNWKIAVEEERKICN